MTRSDLIGQILDSRARFFSDLFWDDFKVKCGGKWICFL